MTLPENTHPDSTTFPPLAWTAYEVVLNVEQPLLLPVHKGATLRGSFGQTLKRLVCRYDPATCDARPLACSCPYGRLFAPSTPENNPHLRAGEEVARPFAIEPPLDAKQEYRQGERVIFNLLLFGRAREHLPWFIVTFRELPPIGVPSRRGRVGLHEVWAVHDLSGEKQRIYSAADRLVQNADLTMCMNDETEWDGWQRYSTRQRQEVPMEGVVGQVTYAGDLQPFLPLLLVGQYTHVGKNGVFGSGRYRVLAGQEART